MTAATLTLADFVLARIADDEGVANEATPGTWDTRRISPPPGFEDYGDGATVMAQSPRSPGLIDIVDDTAIEDAAHIARHDPARVLAECAAKRAIVNGHSDYHVCPNFSDAGSTDYVGKYDDPGMRPCPTLLALLSVYADHPDYRSEWAS